MGKRKRRAKQAASATTSSDGDKTVLYPHVHVTYPGSNKRHRIERPTRAMLRDLPKGTMVSHPEGWYVVGATIADIFSD